MPIYEYRCNGCGHEFEQFQGIKDDAVKMCPICNEK
ncbi:MAG: zinc ribbon domain-containing protein, partial [bacterium]|nr:zinc ribbon domain-containing protein [bacterium]